MTECITQFGFGFHKKSVTAKFDGGALSGDGGVVLLRELDDRHGFSENFSSVLPDARQPGKVWHEPLSMIRQRLYQIAMGYEDCNDADELRGDPVLKSVAGSSPDGLDLASQETLSRLENSVGIKDIIRLSRRFVDSYLSGKPRTKLLLELDSTDDPTHGQQEFTFYHGYYRQHMYHPLLIHDGETGELILPVLRAGNTHSSRGVVPILRRLVRKIKSAWPAVVIELRADAGFAVPDLYEFCEREGIIYTIGLITNNSLRLYGQPLLNRAVKGFEETNEKQRIFDEFGYKAGSWSRYRRVVVKAECQVKGTNHRFVVTNRDDFPQDVYDDYVKRGEQENRIKELKNDLKADRLSCHRFAANCFRLLLHSMAYRLICALRETLKGTELEKAQTETLRRRLLKIGVRVVETVRRIWLHFAESFADKKIFALALEKTRTGTT